MYNDMVWYMVISIFKRFENHNSINVLIIVLLNKKIGVCILGKSTEYILRVTARLGSI